MNASTTIIPAGAAPLRVLLTERNALSDRLNEGAWTDEAAAVVCNDIDRLEARAQLCDRKNQSTESIVMSECESRRSLIVTRGRELVRTSTI